MKLLQIKDDRPVFEKIFPFVFSTNLATTMPTTFLIASEWSLVAVLICWLYASNSPSAVHPTVFFLGKQIYIFDYSEYNRFNLHWAKWKSKKKKKKTSWFWKSGIKNLFFLFIANERSNLSSIHPEMYWFTGKIEINAGFGVTHHLAGTTHAKSTYSALIKLLPVCVLQHEQVLL